MENIDQIVANWSIVVTAGVGIVTLFFTIVKTVKNTIPYPYWKTKAYKYEFCDILTNNGVGYFKIENIEYYLDDKLINVNKITKIYRDELRKKNAEVANRLFVNTVTDNSSLIGRVIQPEKKIVLMNINLQKNKNLLIKHNMSVEQVKEILKRIRKRIEIKLTYSQTYGPRKCISLYSCL